MSVTFVHHSPFFVSHHNAEKLPHLLVFDPVLEKRPLLSIGDRYRQLDPSLRVADCVVFRGCDRSIEDRVRADVVLSDQLRSKDVWVLCPTNNRMKLAKVFGNKYSNEVFDKEYLRQLELESVLARSEAVFAAPNEHYVLPSGMHAEGFIDLHSVVFDPVNVSRIADWIVPYLSSKTALLSDTGILTPLLIQLQLEALRRFRWTLPVAALHGYPSDLSEMRDAIVDLRDRVGASARVLFLLSVNLTGRIARLFRALAPDNCEVLALFHTRHKRPDIPLRVMCTRPVTRWPVDQQGNCEVCSSKSKILIDPVSLERCSYQQWNIVEPKKALAAETKAFWEMADAADAVRLHVNVSYNENNHVRSRHHAIYIDTERMSQNRPFIDNCANTLKSAPPPDCVIVPEHQNSPHVVKLVKDVFGDIPKYFVIPSARFADAVKTTISTSTSILLADDALVSGATLFGFKQEIYRVCQAAQFVPQLHCFAMLARPSGPEALRYKKLPFFSSDGHHFSYGAQVFLPLGAESCPWCKELNILQTLVVRLKPSSQRIIRQRIMELDVELQTPFLLGRVYREKDPRTVGSFFGTLSDRAAFSAVSSAAHRLAHQTDQDNLPGQVTVISVPFILSAYFDSVILAGFLRTLRRKELYFAGHDDAIRETLDAYPSHLAYPGNVPELLWAAINDKLPADPVLRLAERCPDPDPMLIPLKEMLQLILRSK
jgi:hypothetical protein